MDYNPTLKLAKFMIFIAGHSLKNDVYSQVVSVFSFCIVSVMFILGLLNAIKNFRTINNLPQSFEVITNYCLVSQSLLIATTLALAYQIIL